MTNEILLLLSMPEQYCGEPQRLDAPRSTGKRFCSEIITTTGERGRCNFFSREMEGEKRGARVNLNPRSSPRAEPNSYPEGLLKRHPHTMRSAHPHEGETQRVSSGEGVIWMLSACSTPLQALEPGLLIIIFCRGCSLLGPKSGPL